MQLKIVGEAINITNTIDKTLKATAALSNIYGGEAFQAQKLAIALSGYSTEAIKAAIAQSTLNETQIRAILVEKGYEGQLLETTTAELAQATATNALTASQTGATASTLGLGTAFKGLGASMKAFALSNPILTAIAAIGVTIYGAVKAYDALTVSVEEANEAMDGAVSEYESAKSSLESINTELEEQNKKMDELLAKENLTYAEKGQLEELQAITKELLLQQDIEQKRADKASKEAADKAVDAFQKQYGKYDTTEEDLKERLSYQNFPLPDSEDDVLGMVAAYIRAKELLEQSQKDFDIALKNGEDTTWLAEDVQSNIDAVDDYKQALDRNISDLQEKRLALEDEYNKAVEKNQQGIEPLTSLDKEVIETYESIYDAIKMIYEYTDQNTWNGMEISNIFNTEGIEKTKEELISMYQSGELSSAEMLEQFPKLNAAIKESELIAGEGSDAFKEFFNEIAALADETEDTIGSITSNTLPSLSDLLNTEDLSDTKKELIELAKSGELTPDTFTSTKEYMRLLEQTGLTAKQACDEIKKLPEFDMDLSDWQTQVKNARSSISELKDMLDELTSSDSKGLVSSSVDKIISDYPMLLQYLSDTPKLIEEINGLIADQSDIANDAANQILEYSSDTYIKIRDIAKETVDDITVMQNGQVQSVAEMYGIDLNNYSNLAQAKKSIEFALLGSLNEGWAEHFGIVIDSLTGMAKVTQDLGGFYADPDAQSRLAAYNELITKLNAEKAKFESGIDHGLAGIDKSKSSSKSEKDTTKEFDWIEQAIENVKKEVNNLDDTVNSAYSTLSQKNTALAQEIGKVSEEIRLQQQAYDTYMQKAESFGLSDEYKTLIRDGAINIENISDENLQKKISDYQQWYEKAVDASEAISELSSRVKDLHVKGYELQVERLEELLDNEAITEKQYISEMTKLYKQYYENQTEYAVQAHEAKLALLNREKDYLNSVASAAASLFDKEIDKIQDNADAQMKPYQDRIKDAEKQIKAYEKQIDVFEKQIDAHNKEIDAYNKEIDLINDRKKPLQDELDALDDKVRKENLVLDLQKKQYEQKRAENQRDKLVNYMPDTIVI